MVESPTPSPTHFAPTVLREGLQKLAKREMLVFYKKLGCLFLLLSPIQSNLIGIRNLICITSLDEVIPLTQKIQAKKENRF